MKKLNMPSSLFASRNLFFAVLFTVGITGACCASNILDFNDVRFSFIFKPQSILGLKKKYITRCYDDHEKYKPIKSQSYQQICLDYPVISRRPNSKPNDYLVGAVFLEPSNMLPFIGTLRKTGCKATVVCLCDNVAYYNLFKSNDAQTKNKEIPILFQKLGGYIINIGYVSTRYKVSGFFSKVMVCYDFIKIYSKFIDRVMIIDILDIVFQGDPFTEEIIKNQITFFSEFADFGKEHFWTGTLARMKNVNMSKIFNKPIINGGTYASDPITLLNFLDIFFKNVGKDMDFIEFDDQAFINYIVHMGILQENKINFRIITEPEGYVIIYSTFGVINKLKSYKIGEIKSTNAILPSLIVHQFERSCKICSHLREICPKPKNISWKLFHRKRLLLDNGEKCDLEWD